MSNFRLVDYEQFKGLIAERNEFARQLQRIKEKRALYQQGGTKVTNCVVHMNLPIDARPTGCDLCMTDIQNFIRMVLRVNDFANKLLDEYEAIVLEEKQDERSEG